MCPRDRCATSKNRTRYQLSAVQTEVSTPTTRADPRWAAPKVYPWEFGTPRMNAIERVLRPLRAKVEGPRTAFRAPQLSAHQAGVPGGTREDGLRANWSTQTEARGPFAITSHLPLRRVCSRDAKCAMALSASVLYSTHAAAARFTPWFTPQRDTKVSIR